ncbi:MAG TPA: tRNA glutamyl-Q(34) synthetase GluQRS [Blastocatellia bacterium]|nr:tRNA glutamyl-Q(34) synthetase GluQRS [Blastocatellia bacterium]HMZ17497.1 tRNA glutamyl-Q(34) synthetase GluQRS [Blastocatellia bacterium]HNG33379.1 tRNA glutamyl-Q(34) synthetase GluQRS [Blastocatellia bacterium]
MVVGRFAPSPTGALHLGNLRTALASWLSAKSRGGKWIIRIEDVDTARCRAEWAEAQLRDLAALGLVSDAPVVWQSQRDELYRAALDQLARQDRLYRCACSRKDLQLLASAPHAEDGVRPYPGSCRAAKVTNFVGDALRAELPPGAVEWQDLLLCAQTDDPAATTGDPVLHRRDGCFAYHLAVVVDDAEQGVTEVVRGADLREVTATQIRLQELLGLPRPAYAHLGLVTAPDGSRLGKRAGAANLAALAERGIGAEQVIGWLGWSLGCQGCLLKPEACRAEELIEHFAWSKVSAAPCPVPKAWA